MMSREQSLKRRIGGAFFLLAFVLCTFFSLAAYIAVEVSEEQLIDQRLAKEAAQLIDRHQKKLPGPPVENNFFFNENIPPIFRNLPDGLQEIEVDGKEITVIIRRVGSDTYAVSDDTSDFEITEVLIFTSIVVGFVSSLLLSVILGLAFAKRIVAPVTALAEAVARDDDPSTLPSLKTQDEIGTLARAFAMRTEKLQQFLSDEKLFTGDVSHELRTPLTIMLGAAELLEVRLANSPEELVVAERIRRIAAEASERVGALLLLSQSPDALHGVQLSLTHLVEREVDRYRQLLGDKPVQIVFDGGTDEVWVHARAELVGIAIGNLIRNACQYTDQGSVLVKLTSERLIIEDNGPGVPENVRARLFSRFVRGSENQHVGSGLGLAIVKRVIDHLGWHIHHETPAQGGSRFIISYAESGPHFTSGSSAA